METGERESQVLPPELTGTGVQLGAIGLVSALLRTETALVVPVRIAVSEALGALVVEIEGLKTDADGEPCVTAEVNAGEMDETETTVTEGELERTLAIWLPTEEAKLLCDEAPAAD